MLDECHNTQRIAFHDTLPWLVTASDNKLDQAGADKAGACRVYNTRDWSLVKTLFGQDWDPICEVVFHRTQPLLVVGAYWAPCVYDTRTWEILAELPSRHVTSVAFHPTQPLLAVSSWDAGYPVVSVFDTRDWEVVRTIDRDPINKEAILRVGFSSVTFHPTEPYLVASVGHNFEVYDIVKDWKSTSISSLNAGRISALALQTSMIAAATADNKVRLQDFNTHTLLHSDSLPHWQTIDHPDTISSVCLHETQPLLATSCDDRKFRVYDSNNLELLQTIDCPADKVHEVAFHPTQPLLAAAASSDKEGAGGARVYKIGEWL